LLATPEVRVGFARSSTISEVLLMVDIMINAAIGVAAAVFTGLVLLFFEYRTGWFAAKVQVASAAAPKRYRRLTPSEARKWLFLLWPIWFFVMFFVVLGAMIMLLNYITSPGPSTLLDNPGAENIVHTTVYEKFTKSFFDNSIYITLNEVTPTITITCTIGSPGVESKVYSNVPNGYSFLYESSSNYYDVRVTSINTGVELPRRTADFVITRLPP
jgi:multisubunit Na+/H+ antiporter MnhB subunit